MELQELQQSVARSYGQSSPVKPGRGPGSLKDVQDSRGELAVDRVGETGLEREKFKQFAQGLETFMGNLGVRLKFHIHEDTGELQAEVLDAGGKKVIRKVPPDEILNLAASLKEISGLFMNRSL